MASRNAAARRPGTAVGLPVMKAALQLRLGQALTMTPQLQQAIRLLQLSTLELQVEIQEALESNLMLEAGGEGDGADDGTTDRLGESAAVPEDPAVPSQSDHDTPDRAPGADGEPLAMGDSIPDVLALDTGWDDIYGSGGDAGTSSWSEPIEAGENQSAARSLREHLGEQLALRSLGERDAAIAEVLIDSLGDAGYLEGGLEDILEALPRHWQVDLSEVEAVRHLIQHLDPPGVASLNPSEALTVQLQQLPADTPARELALCVVRQHLGRLANGQLDQLCKRLQVDAGTLSAAIHLIRSLDPRPGAGFQPDQAEYIVPDVFVRREQGRWQVELNTEALPRLRVNRYYASLIRRADTSHDNSIMRQHLQEARWFIKSLHSRSETLLKVASCIVRHQREFLDFGEEAMKPLVLRAVAEEVGMHESTISRVTTRKYMHTPRGSFEFKYFFSSHVSSNAGEALSATAIRARIRKLIARESGARPLSDSRLTDLLQSEGINVARRTVAKYRESMGIASSSERRRVS